MGESVDVIVAGHLCLDLLPHMAHVPLDALASPGKQIELGGLTMSMGGAVSNTGIALHKLGVPVRLMANIGDDLLGDMTLALVQTHAPLLAESLRVITAASSSYSILLAPAGSDRIILHAPGANATFGAEHIDYDLVARAKVFHLGYPNVMPRLCRDHGDELVRIYTRAKATGVVISLDVSHPDPHGESGRVDWPRVLSRTLPHTDIFIPSIEEIVFMLRRADYDTWRGDVMPHIEAAYLRALAQDLIGMGVIVAGFKLGAAGLYLHMASGGLERLARLPLDLEAWRGAEIYHPAFAVAVAGTTGAGDAAYAGLIHGMLAGQSPRGAARWACAVGACCVEAINATDGIHSAAETQARLESGWTFNAARVRGFEA